LIHFHFLLISNSTVNSHWQPVDPFNRTGGAPSVVAARVTSLASILRLPTSAVVLQWYEWDELGYDGGDGRGVGSGGGGSDGSGGGASDGSGGGASDGSGGSGSGVGDGKGGRGTGDGGYTACPPGSHCGFDTHYPAYLPPRPGRCNQITCSLFFLIITCLAFAIIAAALTRTTSLATW
jgi:hypothetical protein